MKKVLAILAVIILCLSLCACNSSVTPSEDDKSSSPSSQVVSENEDILPLADDTYDMRDGIPPLNDNLKQLYNESMELYRSLLVGKGESVTVDGKANCYKLDGYTTVKELEDAALEHFTDGFYEKNIKELIEKCFEKDGVVYVETTEPKVTSYLGHYFEIDMVYADSVELTAFVFNNDLEGTDTMKYMDNLGLGDCYVLEYDFVLEKGEDGWRFSEFSRFY